MTKLTVYYVPETVLGDRNVVEMQKCKKKHIQGNICNGESSVQWIYIHLRYDRSPRM